MGDETSTRHGFSQPLDAKKLRRLMFLKGLKPGDLASRAGVSQRAVYRALAGDPMRLTTALAISLALTDAPEKEAMAQLMGGV